MALCKKRGSFEQIPKQETNCRPHLYLHQVVVWFRSSCNNFAVLSKPHQPMLTLAQSSLYSQCHASHSCPLAKACTGQLKDRLLPTRPIFLKHFHQPHYPHIEPASGKYWVTVSLPVCPQHPLEYLPSPLQGKIAVSCLKCLIVLFRMGDRLSEITLCILPETHNILLTTSIL